MSIERSLSSVAGSSAGEATYIEDVFSTYLYTGNGTSQTINNGIDLDGEGGMVWLKNRTGIYDHWLWDTGRGAGYSLRTNQTAASANIGITEGVSFSSTGFSIGNNINWNGSGINAASWTFRQAPKFFDVVTYTGNGVAGRTVAHDLGSVPGMIIVKSISSTGAWTVYHRSLTVALGGSLYLNSTAAQDLDPTNWNSTNPTASVFTLGSGATNTNGATYVAYLFAHDAGGFGDSGTDSVVSCGSYTGNGSASGPTVTLGWEPQYVMVKRTDSVGAWFIEDVMRGMSQTRSQYLLANSSAAEVALNPSVIPTATGFTLGTTYGDLNASGGTYIYLAIRRGPMRTPTDGTSVFSPGIYTGTLTAANPNNRVLAGADWWMNRLRTGSTNYGQTRLCGWNFLTTTSTSAESSAYVWTQTNQTTLTPNIDWWSSSVSQGDYYFRRAPGFFDVVCYTGTGVARTVNHNLGVAPELMIIKSRSLSSSNWVVTGNVFALPTYQYIFLNSSDVLSGIPDLFTNPTSTTFGFGSYNPAWTDINSSGATYVAYLFSSCPGVSKVGSYTGTGAAQTIDCGFTGGARFVLIKRTDSTGDWYTYDTARGMVSGTDPYLLMNSTAAEVNANYVFTSSTGFTIQTAAPAGINASGGTFIYLAIA